MTTISTDQQVTTLINVFTARPERQEELIGLLVEMTEQAVRHLPGFISANFHRGEDGRHVANYAQWRSRADFEAFLHDPSVREWMERTRPLVTDFQPMVYQVVETFLE
jgi:quinol monooxygenase YgiN